MRFSGKNLRTKIIVWLAAEILLTSLGTDDLADYSEFIFEMNLVKIEMERKRLGVSKSERPSASNYSSFRFFQEKEP